MAGTPLVAIARHFHVQPTDFRFHVPANISQTLGEDRISIKTPIHILDMSTLTGVDDVSPDDIVYVHMAKGPDFLAYPFALTRSRPSTTDSPEMFSVRAQVVKMDQNNVSLRYTFDTISLTSALDEALIRNADISVKAEITVRPNASPLLTAIIIGEDRYSQRVIVKPELKAFTQRGASNIPIR